MFPLTMIAITQNTTYEIEQLLIQLQRNEQLLENRKTVDAKRIGRSGRCRLLATDGQHRIFVVC